MSGTTDIVANAIISNSIYTNSLNGAFPVSSTYGTLVQSGIDSQDTTGTGQGFVNFTYPYTSIPVVIASINSSSNTEIFQVQLSNISLTGFNFTKLYSNGSSITPAGTESFNWIAIGSV